jgi:hypothetical protein
VFHQGLGVRVVKIDSGHTAGVVDQNVEWPAGAELLDEPNPIIRVGQVGGHGQDARIIAPCGV